MSRTVLFDFESSLAPWLANGYQFPLSEDNTIALSTDHAHTGSHSLKVTTLDWHNVTQSRTRTPEIFDGEPNAVSIAGRGGTTIGWDCWAYADDGNVAGFGSEWIFWDAEPEAIGQAFVNYVPAVMGEWVSLSVGLAEVPADAIWLTIRAVAYLNTFIAGTTYYIDDFGIIDGVPAPVAEVCPAQIPALARPGDIRVLTAPPVTIRVNSRVVPTVVSVPVPVT